MKILKSTLIFVIAVATFSFSQSSSTYTRYGIGDLNYTYSARSLGLGKTGTALQNQDFVEVLNPSSWSALKFTRVEFSLVLNGVQLSDNKLSKFYTDAEFKGFTFAFPISEKYGIGFASGLIPYSRISYKVVESKQAVATYSSDYTATYEGNGGLSRLFMGSSYITPIDWVVGISFEYYFGKQTYSSLLEFVNPSHLPAEFELDYRSTGFGTTLGVLSENLSGLFNSEAISNLRIGVSVNLISELNTDTSLTINPKTVADTITSGSTKTKIPIRVASGITLQLDEEYNFNLDYIYQPWSDYTVGGVHSEFLRDVHRFGLGFEYLPKRKPGSTKWEQIIWRASLSYELTQYVIYGHDITQYSAFAGLSFPLGVGNSFDFGFQYSLRGTTESNLIKENFFRINVGISFGELWFLRVER